jgi:hypothetical protein
MECTQKNKKEKPRLEAILQLLKAIKAIRKQQTHMDSGIL